MDVTIIRLVIAALGIIGGVCIGGVIYLSALGQEPPHSLSGIASAAIGALVGILAAPRPQERPANDKAKD